MAFAQHMMPPPMEEAMDMSSPNPNQLYDGDIDIDYNYGGGAPMNDDEHMSEDGQFPRPGTAVTDDFMSDADHVNVTSVPTIVEEEMQDSDDANTEQQVNDEELIDYDDEIFPDPPQEAPVGDAFQTQEQSQMKEVPVAQPADSSFLAPTEVLDNDEVDEEIVRGPEDVALEVVGEPKAPAADGLTTAGTAEPAENVQAAAQNETEPAQQVGNAEEQNAADTVADAPAKETAVHAVSALEAVEAPAAAQQPSEHAPPQAEVEQDTTATAQKVPPRHPGVIDVSAKYATDAPPTPTDLTLHAMLIKYGAYQWPLFKSRAQPEGLLKDDNLLNVSLTDLLSNIRTRLASKVDEADMITEARELVLCFDIFGSMIAEVCNTTLYFERSPLTIVQSSLHASSTSLNDVLGVYLTLHKNDDVDEQDTPPLFMTLTTQPNFMHNLASLKHMAAIGLGLPKVTIEDQHNTPIQDEDEQQSEEAADHETAEFADDQEEYPEVPEDDEHDQDYPQYHDPADGDEHEHDTVGYEEGQYQDGEDDDYHYEDTVAQPAEDTGTFDGAADEALDPEVPTTNAEDNVQAAPDASSAVVREPAANDTTGEYTLEDYIDWEDDDLTDSTTELHEDDGEDEYSALLNEYTAEAGEAAPAASAEGHEDEHADDAEHDPYLDEHTQEAADDTGLGHGDGEQQPTTNGDTASTPADVVDSKAHAPASNTSAQDAVEEPFTFDLLDDDGNEPFDDNDEVADPARQHEPENDEDDIGFELDDDEPAPVSPATSTPGNKRPYEQPADEDHIDFDEPETKKARAD